VESCSDQPTASTTRTNTPLGSVASAGAHSSKAAGVRSPPDHSRGGSVCSSSGGISTPLIKSPRSFTPPLIQSRCFTPPLIKSRSFTPPLIASSREGSAAGSLSPLGSAGELAATPPVAAKRRTACKKITAAVAAKPSTSITKPR
jgi:hypothetical protein